MEKIFKLKNWNTFDRFFHLMESRGYSFEQCLEIWGIISLVINIK